MSKDAAAIQCPFDAHDRAECSRCKVSLAESFLSSTRDMTVGYYDVLEGQWSQFANDGEAYLCDECMWSDPRYIAMYGTQGEKERT